MESLVKLARIHRYFNNKKNKKILRFDGNKTQLNSDVHYEICKYLGKIMGRINKDLNKRWKNDGICIEYDYKIGLKTPEDLEKYVKKMILLYPSIRPNELARLKNLKEVYIDCKYVYNSSKYIIKVFNHLETVILEEKHSINIYWVAEINKLDQKNLYVKIDKSLLKYKDFQDFRNKYVDNRLLNLLKSGEKLDIVNESKYEIMLHDSVLVYLYLSDRKSEFQNSEKKPKISVIMTDDPLQIEFYIKIKLLYEEIGIETDMDIYGKMSKCYYTINIFEKQSLYSALKNFSRDDLENIIQKSIENYGLRSI
jgi:hypothetical protein